MASITRQASGRREIQFSGPDGRRRTIRLGPVDQKTAESTRLRVEELVAAATHGVAASFSTSQWLATLGDQMHGRLVRAGLCSARSEPAAELTLATMIDQYIVRRDDVKPGTKAIYLQAKKHLQLHFGATRLIRSITSAEAGDYRRALRKKYSEAYTAKMIIKARTFWRDAADRGLADTNVFLKVQAGSQVNTARHRFVDRLTMEKVIAACPDAQWKLLLALSRYAGLRCPSEHLALRWDDIDWDKSRMTVRAIKTEHHADHGVRAVPIFEPLRPYLRAVYESREADATHVITRYRQANSNLRTQLMRYIEKAGLKPWPRLFHNLRASCQTELAERFPSHVVCGWIGNSELVARKHYLQTTDEHFAKAAGTSNCVPESGQKSDAKSDAVTGGIASQGDAPAYRILQKVMEIREIAKTCEVVQLMEWAIEGSNLRPHGCDPCALAN